MTIIYIVKFVLNDKAMDRIAMRIKLKAIVLMRFLKPSNLLKAKPPNIIPKAKATSMADKRQGASPNLKTVWSVVRKATGAIRNMTKPTKTKNGIKKRWKRMYAIPLFRSLM